MKKIISKLVKLCFVSALLFTQLPQINNIVAAERENIALNKTVTSSNTEYNRGPELAVDGNKSNSTFWDGGAFGNYMTVDLGQVYDIDEICVYTYWDGERYYKYDIMGSLDGVKFEPVTKKENDNISVENGDRYNYEKLTAKYIRIKINYNSSKWGNIQLCELEVFGNVHERTNDENIALNKPVINVDTGNKLTELTDGDDGSFVKVDKRAEYLINLEKRFSYDELNFISANFNETGYIIKGSKDGSNFKELTHGIINKESINISLNGYCGKYLKIIIQNSVELKEIKVFGSETEILDPNTNLAIGKTIIASATANGKGPNNAIDGNVDSWWDGGTTGQYVTLDLNEYYDISKIKVVTYFGDQRFYKYVVSTSDDGQNYKPIYTKYDESPSTREGNTYELDGIIARYVRITILENSSSWGSVHLNELEVYGDEVDFEQTNIAIGKAASATNCEEGYSAQEAIDNNYLSAWKGISKDDSLTIDFNDTYNMDSLSFVTESNQEFTYNIYSSRDNSNFDLIASGTAFNNDLISLKNTISQYLRIMVISKDDVIPVYEIKVSGKGIELAKDGDIAYQKPVRTNVANTFSSVITDQNEDTVWIARYYPCYIDIDLMDNYNVDKIKIQMQNATGYYRFSVYTSKDGTRFDKVLSKNDKEVTSEDGFMTYDLNNADDVRIVRVQFEYNSTSANIDVSSIRLYGEKSGTEIINREDLNYISYKDSEYANNITDAEVIKNVKQLIARNFGEEYVDWFTFSLKDKEAKNDYFEIKDINGKISISGNKGLSLTTGLYHYLKYYAKVQLTEVDTQPNMPDKVVPVNEIVRKETPYEVRYAFNYCTLSYTLAFFGQDDWQRELDWLALNGVNVVLDLNGQEAVWHSFLKKIGYTDEEAKDWLTGPGYYAWQFMSNMETFNGPVSNTWIQERLDLARKNQHYMKVLGMEPVYQAYSGEIPVNIKEKDPDIDIVTQGFWMRFDRPSMIRTTSESYQKYSDLFYEAQEEVLGNNTHYYATDPFHEGGNKGDMDEAEIGRIIYDKLKEVHLDATWIVQSWSLQAKTISNLTEQEKQDGLLVLDLEADKFPRWEEVKENSFSEKEFNGSPWVFCILDNFGGRQGVQAELDLIAGLADNVFKKANHMKGIGVSSEGTWANPIQYELLFESAWNKDSIDLDDWIDQYVERRYGLSSNNAQAAWDVFRNTAYKYPKGGHTGNPESVINATPRFNIAYVAPQGSINIPYDTIEFEKGVELLLEDYDKLKDSEGYKFDITDMLRQYLSNTALDYYRKFTNAYQEHDKVTFDYFSQRFLDLIDLQDKVLGTNKEFLVGTWIQRAKDLGIEYKEDDFQKDMLERNARALITTWGSYEMSSLIFSHDGINYSGGTLQDYANRQYAGLTTDYYKPRWEKWIASLNETFDKDDYNDYTFDEGFELGWNWSLDQNEYPTNPSGNVKELANEVFGKYGLKDDYKINLEIVYEDTQKVEHSSVYVHKGITSNITLDLLPNNHIKSVEGKDIKFDYNSNSIQINDINKDTSMKVIVASKAIDKSDLADLIQQVELLNANNYTNDSWLILQKSLENAKSVINDENATQEEINNALIYLHNAKDSLIEVINKINKTALSIAIKMAKAVTDEELTKVVPAVANEFIAALENAQNVYDNAKASQEKVDNAFDRLAKVMQMLEFYKGDKTTLQKMMDQIAGLTANDYTEATWNALQEVLLGVNEVLGNENAMQGEVDEAYGELVKAFVNLRLKPNKDLLQGLINQANGINRSSYTATSLKLVDDEIAKANLILNNSNATEEEVNNAVNGLTKAIAGLVENNPVIDNNVETPNTLKPGDTTVNAIKTGDNSAVGATLALMTLSLVGYYVSKKRIY